MAKDRANDSRRRPTFQEQMKSIEDWGKGIRQAAINIKKEGDQLDKEAKEGK